MPDNNNPAPAPAPTTPPPPAGEAIVRKVRSFFDTLFSLPAILCLILGASLYYIYLTSKGSGEGIADIDYARGLITLLFAVGTIAVTLILTIAAIFQEGVDGKTRFEHGRQILGVLIGIFGTIVGFYFGSVGSETKAVTAPTIESIEPDIIPQNSEPKLLLRGRRFSSNNLVLVDGLVFRPTAASSSQIEIQLTPEATSLAIEKAVRVLDADTAQFSNSATLSISPPDNR